MNKSPIVLETPFTNRYSLVNCWSSSFCFNDVISLGRKPPTKKWARPLFPEFVYFTTQVSNFVPYFVELLHGLVYRVAFMVSTLFVQFSLSGFGFLSDMFCDVMQASVTKMLDSNSHVF